MHLLVLDDEPAIGSFLVRVAGRSGWTAETTVAEEGFQEAFRMTLPDLIMLDLQIGSSDGIEQLRFLHGEGFRGAIVLMSGVDARVLASADQVGASLGLQILAVLQKPVSIAEVRRVFREAVGRIFPIGLPGGLPAVEPAISRLTAADVGEAIEAGALRLFLQPVVSASSRAITSFEALVRWQHPGLGMIQPDHFIGLAEQDDDVIDRLTLWVGETAITHHQRIAAALGRPLSISVNVSGANLNRLDFPDRLDGLLAAQGVAAGAISLEVTETVAMRDPRATIDILTRLRLKGFRIALDDFGTGFSSFKALLQMPFSSLKIDKSFVLDLMSSQDCRIIVKAVINLAKDMKIESVAEGVETEEIAVFLTDLGVTSLQGYHFSRPLPLDDVIARLV